MKCPHFDQYQHSTEKKYCIETKHNTIWLNKSNSLTDRSVGVLVNGLRMRDSDIPPEVIYVTTEISRNSNTTNRDKRPQLAMSS